MAPLSYKKNLKPTPALQLFYTGGPVRLAPDASFVACACGDEVKIVDLTTGTLSKTFQGDSEPITALAISPDGKSVFASSRSLQVKQWDLSTVSVRRSWKAHEDSVVDMAVDASGGLLATASADRSVRVWDVDGGFCTHAFRGHKGVVTRAIFHPDPHRLLLFTGGDDATVRVWDLVTKKCAATLEKHFSVVTSLAISMNGWSLLSGARDKVVNVWSLRDYSHEATIPVYEALEAVCVVPDGCNLPGSGFFDASVKRKSGKPRFLTAGELGIVRVFSSDGGNCIYKQKSCDVALTSDKDDLKHGFTAAFVLPYARGIMCVTADHRLLFYEPMQTDDGQSDLRISKRLIGYNDEVTDLKFVGDDESLLAVASNVEQVRLYDLASMACTQELTGHSDIVLCLDTCVSPQGRPFLASGGKDHTVRLWDVESGICIAMAAGHMAAVGAIAFSKKHRNFLVTGSRDRTIKLWGLEGVLEARILDMPWKLSSQAVVAAHDKDINSVAVAPNDTLICSGSQDSTARVWKLPELILVSTLRGHKRGVWSVEFSPVDQAVLTASGDKTIRIWALSDGSCLKTFEGHTASVLKASFLSRGTQLISSGADGLLKLWTIKSNECVNTFDQHTDKIWALAVSGKSELLASGGSDSMVNLWTDCTAADEEEAARKEAEETLKDQDLANALADTDYEKAIQLAFELRRPFKLLNVFTELFRAGGDNQVASILKKLDREYLRLLLEYVREWNSKSKFCYVAQCVLLHIFNVFPPSEINQVPGISELLEGILPYTQRHFSRIDRLARSCFLLDYTLACMSVLRPSEANSGMKLLLDNGRFQPGNLESSWNNQSEVCSKKSNNSWDKENLFGALKPSSSLQETKGALIDADGEQHPSDVLAPAELEKHTSRKGKARTTEGEGIVDAAVEIGKKKKKKKLFMGVEESDGSTVKENGVHSASPKRKKKLSKTGGDVILAENGTSIKIDGEAKENGSAMKKKKKKNKETKDLSGPEEDEKPTKRKRDNGVDEDRSKSRQRKR